MAFDTTTLMNDIKLALGSLSSTKFDNPIAVHIEAGKADLIAVGINASKVVESDPLIYTALMQFVLSKMDNIERREIAGEAYELLKDSLRHYSDYNTETN